MSDLQSLMNHDDDDYNYNYIPKQQSKPNTRKIKREPSSETSQSINSDTNVDDQQPLPTSVSQEQILQSFERIKTHFPAARIKKIMQSDEEIGKVAQATPIIVGRALEIFMANLVESSILEAKKQGVKRIGVNHIKSAIDNNEKFDFLVDIVKK